ncbi:DUF899 domain-containing protein [Kibdelosporangium phytohabitans]|uniref:Thioredoxin n=1 Tax=Kibdelosporangium phytohabitans TaxID=860235 RepID=A0A0N7F406_9PSEU|nr:DUF899 domain-containing protein [Kibdelosporangium phytohabitans]ALG10095.1 hypothetical protein AOZ06_27210 [Kibdelosporangium phytohabitans]MBE1461078.1 putative dithiol-disulfide oxidoreductase (DUF899 family) [Kibdelosporangium phytohabitans]
MTTALPPVVSQQEWLAARKALLAKEKEATKLRDQINAERRRLPMVRVEKDYVFTGPDGELSLAGLFEGRSQLYIHHFMWRDDLDTGCPSCTASAGMNFTPQVLAHLHSRDITFAAVSRAPAEKIQAYKAKHDWTFPWYSSHGSDFSYDMHASLDESRRPVEYNYLSKEELKQRGFPEEMMKGDMPANSVFLRDGDEVFHTYTAYTRGLDQLFTPYNFIDFTPYGRQETWEDSPEGWPKLTDRLER